MGQKHAAYDEAGKIVGFYDSVDSPVPDGVEAIEITDAEWLECLSTAGYSVADGHLLPPQPPTEDELADALIEAKATYAAAIDKGAEAARLRYITGGSGQAMTYQQKASEAAAALAVKDPDPADYPLLVAEIGITAPTLQEVATVVDGAYQQWRVVGAAIEALRLGGKAAVSSAETIEAVKAAAEIQWP